jgi:hypothetical protein
MAFEMNAPDQAFQGRISDPMPVVLRGDRLMLEHAVGVAE